MKEYKEIWQPVTGYEGLYEVSNFGRVKSLDHKRWAGKSYCLCKGKYLKAQKVKRGYMDVSLSKNGKVIKVKVHRLQFQAFHGYLPDVIDHIDRNKTNNHLNNLRRANKRINSINRGLQTNNKTGFRGVHFDKKSGKYRAKIKNNGKNKHIGVFDCPVEAAKAYDRAAKELHGEFASTNFNPAEEIYIG